jgi:hypothetical protein
MNLLQATNVQHCLQCLLNTRAKEKENVTIKKEFEVTKKTPGENSVKSYFAITSGGILLKAPDSAAE